jgi:transglutaminase superfamily protein
MTSPTQAGRREALLRPGTDELLDGGLLLLTAGLALIGFRTSFSDWGFFGVGLAGAVLGLLVAHLANVLRLPVFLLAIMTAVTFFLLGGIVALRGTPGVSLLPVGQTLRTLATQAVHGWKQLLTTLPPVGSAGPLLVLPYILGLSVGAAGFAVARRSRLSFGPIGISALALLLVILLGTETPAARLLQGGFFALVALGWAALRSRRLRAPVRNGSGRAVRIATTAVLLAITLAGSMLFGPELPGAGAHQRTVLRNYVRPPVDIGQYPSPLAGFRKYTAWKKDTLYGQQLFTVSGLPDGTPVRIATLDAYTGTVWTAANQAQSTNLAPDTFQKVGATIANPARGTPHTMKVTVDKAYTDYWLPTAGAVTAVHFTGARANELAANLRFNLATGTALVPEQVRPGDQYTLQMRLPSNTVLQASDPLLVIRDAGHGTADFLDRQAQQWATGKAAPTPAAAVLNIADYLLHNGNYSNGEAGHEYYLPGHSVYRLRQFTSGAPPGALVGDDEQYAAAYALMIEARGTPARVVLGAVPQYGVVKGQDVHAWVEVQLLDRSWRMIATKTFMNDTKPKSLQKPQQTPPPSGQLVPPPAAGRPHSSLDDAAQDNSSTSATQPKKKATSTLGSFRLPTWLTVTGKYVGGPLLVFLALCLASITAKAIRRRVRRHRGSPLRQLGTGWRELVDHARDLGTAVPQRRVTRREQGYSLSDLGIDGLANLVDAYVFGPGMPTEQDAASYWKRVLLARKQMSSTVSRWRRMRAAVSLVSWRVSRIGPGVPP